MMTSIRLGAFLPHELAAAFYNFRSGDLFYSLLTGTPDDLWLDNLIKYNFGNWVVRLDWLEWKTMCPKDIAEYWAHNDDLIDPLREYWGSSAPASMERVFPVRLYGDGAETVGLNTFELLSLLTVAPQRSSTWKTRIVFFAAI